MKRTTVGILVFASVVAAGCGPAAVAGGPRSVTQPAAAAPQGTVAITEAAGRPLTTEPLLRTSRPVPTPGGNPITPQTPPTRAPECPPVTANPVGCPPLPKPQPIVPQPGHPSLAICSPLALEQLRFPPGPTPILVCGRGFRPGELVTITVVGRRGTVSASAEAGPDGSFRSPLPPNTCQVMPLYAVARGNQGSVSNALPLLACRRG